MDVAAHHHVGKKLHTLLIADDLTGGADAGVQFAKRGLKTLLLPFRGEGRSPLAARPAQDVLVINTITRGLPPAEAFDILSGLLKGFDPKRFPILYKKIDSTLRGNIGSEIDAILRGNESSPLFPGPVLPGAGPGAGRGDHDGRGKAPGAHGGGPGRGIPRTGIPCLQAAGKPDLPVHRDDRPDRRGVREGGPAEGRGEGTAGGPQDHRLRCRKPPGPGHDRRGRPFHGDGSPPRGLRRPGRGGCADPRPRAGHGSARRGNGPSGTS